MEKTQGMQLLHAFVDIRLQMGRIFANKNLADIYRSMAGLNPEMPKNTNNNPSSINSEDLC